MDDRQAGEYEPGAFSGNQEYIRHTCLLHAAATLNTHGQIHSGSQCKELDDLFQEIERATGWNANRPVSVLRSLWESYRDAKITPPRRLPGG